MGKVKGVEMPAEQGADNSPSSPMDMEELPAQAMQGVWRSHQGKIGSGSTEQKEKSMWADHEFFDSCDECDVWFTLGEGGPGSTAEDVSKHQSDEQHKANPAVKVEVGNRTAIEELEKGPSE